MGTHWVRDAGPPGHIALGRGALPKEYQYPKTTYQKKQHSKKNKLKTEKCVCRITSIKKKTMLRNVTQLSENTAQRKCTVR